MILRELSESVIASCCCYRCADDGFIWVKIVKPVVDNHVERQEVNTYVFSYPAMNTKQQSNRFSRWTVLCSSPGFRCKGTAKKTESLRLMLGVNKQPNMATIVRFAR